MALSFRCASSRWATAGQTTAGFARDALDKNFSDPGWKPPVMLSTLAKQAMLDRRIGGVRDIAIGLHVDDACEHFKGLVALSLPRRDAGSSVSRVNLPLRVKR